MNETKAQQWAMGEGIKARDEHGNRWIILSADPWRFLFDAVEYQELRIVRHQELHTADLAGWSEGW